jgi:hypothetical protein
MMSVRANKHAIESYWNIFSSGKSSTIQRHIHFEVSKVMVVPRDQ